MKRVECYDEGKAVGDLLLAVVCRNGINVNRYLFDSEFSKRMLIGYDDNNPGIIVDASEYPRKIIGYFNFGNWEIFKDEYRTAYLRDVYKQVVKFDEFSIIDSQKEIYLFNYLKYESIKEADKAFIEGLKKKYEIPDSMICRFFKWICKLFKKKISK